MLSADIKKYLAQTQPFKYLTTHELDMVVSHSEYFSFQHNHVIVQQGKKIGGMYIIIKGEAYVEARVLGRGQLQLAELTQGDTFGELNLLEPGLTTATIVSKNDSELIFISSNYFNMLLTFFPEIQQKITQAISENICLDLNKTFNKIKKFILTTTTIFYYGFDENLLTNKPPKLTTLPHNILAPEEIYKIAIFSHLTSQEFFELLQNCRFVKADKKIDLNHFFHKKSFFCIILRGAVESRIIQNKKYVKLGILSPGHLIGSLSYFSSCEAELNYITRESVILLKISFADLVKLRKSDFNLWYKVYLMICKAMVLAQRNAYKLFIRLNSELYVR